MRLNKDEKAFFALLQAGLWEKDINLKPFGTIDFSTVLRLSEEQSVVGIVASGIEHVSDTKLAKRDSLRFIGQTLQLEQQNKAMNDFIAWLIERLREEKIEVVLVKGQGVAQCYENPLWRACGDVDLLLDEENFNRGKEVLSRVGKDIHEENPFDKHFSLSLEGWVVELHGTLRAMLPKRSDDGIDLIQEDTLKNKRIRVWKHDGTNIPLPCPDNDVVFVFTHILKHFFHYGIGIRQICDWSRLLYTYRNQINIELLKSRLNNMRLMTEWKAFGTVAVEYLGMPKDSMPFYTKTAGWTRKAKRIVSFILETGNFGHNRDSSYYDKYPSLIVHIISLWRHTCDSIRHSFIFPLDSVRIWGRMVSCGIRDMFKGK